MMGLAELYRAEFRTSLATMFQYRASLVIWLISQVLDPLIYLIVWSTALAAIGLAGLLLVVSRVVWRVGLRRHSGASA